MLHIWAISYCQYDIVNMDFQGIVPYKDILIRYLPRNPFIFHTNYKWQWTNCKRSFY